MKIVIFDLDDTLVITKELKELRDRREWSKVKDNLHKTYILDKMKFWYKKFIEKEYKIIIVTSSPKKYAEEILKYHRIKYDFLVGYHDTRLHKPSCEPYKKALDNFKDYEKIVIIGNEMKDMLAGTDLYKCYGIKSENYLYNCNQEEIEKNIKLIKNNNYIILGKE